MHSACKGQAWSVWGPISEASEPSQPCLLFPSQGCPSCRLQLTPSTAPEARLSSAQGPHLSELSFVSGRSASAAGYIKPWSMGKASLHGCGIHIWHLLLELHSDGGSLHTNFLVCQYCKLQKAKGQLCFLCMVCLPVPLSKYLAKRWMDIN